MPRIINTDSVNNGIIGANDIRDKAEYGDFQTPLELARTVCRRLKSRGFVPEVLVEPTFGEGNFIIAALEIFPSIRFVYGVEIFEPYFQETQRKIGEIFPQNRTVRLFLDDVFRFSFSEIAQKHRDHSVLVLGNPPWITNSTLGSKNSKNVPRKSNFKNVRGIEALTGKGNFDLGESVVLSMLQHFSFVNGGFAFLVKNGVARNTVHIQRQLRFPLAEMQYISINAKKEFNASVDAGLFVGKFQSETELECVRLDSFEATEGTRFGWSGEKFVSDIEKYRQSAIFDGTSPGIWRQGIKHDCASVMELTAENETFRNGLGETVDIETDLVFPLLKSSNLKEPIIYETRKSIIVTQKLVGQNTDYTLKQYPKTAAYLNKHKELFTKRKSSIYRGKPTFSIFGVGDYSFKPYKIAISGLYKRTLFSLVLPQGDKPVMLDDTCYFLGFDSVDEAICVHHLLNGTEIQNLLNSLVFWDAKRVITKDVLMRLDYGNARLS